MTHILYKILKQDPESREGIITTTSVLGIIVNIIISIVKVMIGWMTSSIAIISEGANGAADALSSLLTLIGTRLAGRHPDEKHPFGYGRLEYLVSLIISVMILLTGSEMLSSSVKRIFHPEEMSISYLIILIIAFSAIIKFSMGIYTIRMGKKANSSALTGIGLESRNDSFASAITIFVSIMYLVFHVSLDAYAGIIISFLIIKSGIRLLKDTVSDLLGRPGEHELALQLYKEIRNTEGILSAADMMLHNYGPDAWSGSVNIEIDHKKTVGEIYSFVHELQLRIMKSYHVTMVFGIYAVDHDHAEIRQLRNRIGTFVKDQEHARSFHAVYMNDETKQIYCDIIVDYELKDWETLREDFTTFMQDHYPDYRIELTIETEFV